MPGSGRMVEGLWHESAQDCMLDADAAAARKGAGRMIDVILQLLAALVFGAFMFAVCFVIALIIMGIAAVARWFL